MPKSEGPPNGSQAAKAIFDPLETAESRHSHQPIRDAGWSRPYFRNGCSVHTGEACRSIRSPPIGSQQPRKQAAHGAGIARTTPKPKAWSVADRLALALGQYSVLRDASEQPTAPLLWW